MGVMSTSATLTRPEADESPIATWRAGFAGLAAGVLGLATATVLAYFVAPSAAPLPAIGALIISVLPDSLINFGKDFLGFADKPVLPESGPQTAADALSRIEIPQEAYQRIGELLGPGASLTISDYGISDETGEGTDFVVLTR